ncbi:Acyl-CoA dehydrogenase [Candidatus Magnetomorum sp. HK-1]|nr:Acyl-CoA dehydrogenase [Candidatus Magnetomorum sp. HK-1]
MENEINDLTDKCASFIKTYPAIEKESFTKKMLQKLSDCGYLGWMTPKSYGGQGKSAIDMIQAGETLMLHTKNLGIVLSWLIHEIVTYWFINGFGNENQKKDYIPKLIKGQLIGSFAVSEPDVGPHPKLLKTRAKQQGQVTQLNGEKTYLTNGPIADLYVVIAISNISNNQKHYSAYIVPENSFGLSRTKPLEFPFVQSSPHGGIILKDCQVPTENLLGEENTAYDLMVKPFREIEDTLMMGPIIGGMQCQLNDLLAQIKTFDIPLDHNQLICIGNLQVQISMARVIVQKSAQLLDENNRSSEYVALLLGFRQLATNFQKYYSELISQSTSLVDNSLTLTKDLCGIGKVALQVMLNKQMNIGKNLLR